MSLHGFIFLNGVIKFALLYWNMNNLEIIVRTFVLYKSGRSYYNIPHEMIVSAKVRL